MLIKAITPEEVSELYVPDIPDFIIDKVNTLILQKFNMKKKDAKNIVLYFKEIRTLIEDAISEQNSSYGTNHTFQSNYLDIENVYSLSGWKIIVKSPAMDEFFDGFFEFHKP